MNQDSSNLRHQHQHEEQQELETPTAHREAAREFASVDEMIRYDAARTVTPESVAQRVKESVAREPKRPARWWQRFFSSE